MFGRYRRVGVFAGHLSILIVAVGLMYLMILEWIYPASKIERAVKVEMSSDVFASRNDHEEQKKRS